MRTLFYQIFLLNWPRKLIAFGTAIVIWTLVNHSITTTRTIASVPVRVVQLPADKTIDGLLPDGTLSNRITLTLRGSKTTLDQLDPADIEVIIDASGKGDEWVADITKRNLVSLNPELDLLNNISSVVHTEFVIKLSRLVTAKIPVNVPPPVGEAPKGYQFLGVWPGRVYHTLSGPEDQLSRLQAQGMELRFDLSEIKRDDLEPLEASAESGHEGEIHLPVPRSWKRVAIPYLGDSLEPINDPEAQNMRLEFLRQELIALDRSLPVHIFYPDRYSETLNPDTYRLAISGPIERVHGIPHLKIPLYLGNVSRLFTEVVRDHLILTIVAVPRKEKELLDWTVQIINSVQLEDNYVTRLSGLRKGSVRSLEEAHIRHRFRAYLRAMQLYTAPEQSLDLKVSLQGSAITVEALNVELASETKTLEPSLPSPASP